MIDPANALLIAAIIAGLVAFVWWPEKGVWFRWQQARHMTERILQEDALKHIHKWEMKGHTCTIESIAGALHISQNETAVLLESMQANGMVVIDQGELRLTLAGRDTAMHIIRAHRLWERHLAEETGFDETEWHARAELQEHTFTPGELDELATRLGNPTHDPHGDPIPTAGGTIEPHGGLPLTQLPLDTSATIVHLEDEPAVVYAQLVAEGLHLGMAVRVTERTPERVRFWVNGDEHMLAPMIANNISVVQTKVETRPVQDSDGSLANVQPGETAVVTQLSPACRGAERRRFMDLGILPGTEIVAELRSPGGDPTAYRIRGAMIALRREQADLIKVKKEAA
ncbi:MAG: FeoA domain-containing protein [Anaerolineales bacterium]|nr:FeoA domain-containing protein [Anaerolineales bacterium]